MTLPGEAAWMTAAMLPISQLCPGEHGHVFARGLSLAHLDAVLRGNDAAERFLAGGAERALAARGVQAVRHHPPDLRLRQDRPRGAQPPRAGALIRSRLAPDARYVTFPDLDQASSPSTAGRRETLPAAPSGGPATAPDRARTTRSPSMSGSFSKTCFT
jgi:hypothetical protein